MNKSRGSEKLFEQERTLEEDDSEKYKREMASFNTRGKVVARN